MGFEDFAVKKAISRVVDTKSHYLHFGHPEVRAFEESISNLFGGINVLGMNSGTDALIVALKVLDVGPGDEVLVPAFSFISTVSCVSWVGATPVFVDIGLSDYAIDPKKIEEKINSKTKAIIVAHLFGQPVLGIDDIIAVARAHKLFVIEDIAQSFSAKIKDADGKWRMVGTIGDLGCLSFSSTKTFAAPGNGGAIITRNGDLKEKISKIRSYGAEIPYYDYPFVGINCKLHEMQAAALRAKLPFFEYWLSHRESIAGEYTKNLSTVPRLLLPKSYPNTKRIWYRYVIRTQARDDLFEELMRFAGKAGRLKPLKNYPVPLPYFSAFRHLGCKPGDFPISEQAASEVVSLPITNYNSTEDALKISEAIKNFFAERTTKI